MLTDTLFMIFVAALTLPIGVASLQCNCFVQMMAIGHNYSLGNVIKVPPAGDSSDINFTALGDYASWRREVERQISAKRIRSDIDRVDQFWPGCDNGTCTIERGNDIWAKMEKIQNQSVDLRAPPSWSRPGCVHAETRIDGLFGVMRWNVFSCGIRFHRAQPISPCAGLFGRQEFCVYSDAVPAYGAVRRSFFSEDG